MVIATTPQGRIRPGYQQTTLGIIPVGWKVERVSDLASIGTGSRNTQDKVEDGTFPFFVRSHTVERINSYSFDGEAVLTAGDGVGTGKVFHYIKGKFDFHQRVYKISDFRGDVDGFYFYLYFSKHFYDRIMSMTAKSSVDSVRLEMIADMQVPVPPVSEQRAIAAAVADGDRLVASLDGLISKKRDIKTGAMQQLLTGKCRLAGFTGEWTVERLSEIAPLQRGFDLPTSRLEEGQYPVVYSNGILKRHSTYMVKAPGVVTGRSGTIGKVTYVEEDYWPHNTSLWVTSFKGNVPKFVYFLYTHIGLEKFSTGSGVPTLNRNDVHSHKVAIPPTCEEQAAIATVLSDMDAEIAALEAQREKTQALKQGMMQELLTGKIRLI